MTPEADPRPARAPANLWRAATIFCLLLLAVGVAAGVSMFEQFSAQLRDLQHKLQQSPQLQQLAVLVDDRGEPALLLTWVGGDNALQVQRLNAVREGAEDSMQLWAVSETGAPRSLGVLAPRLRTLRLELPAQALEGVRRLAISVEDRGGVPAGQSPRLPFLFTGYWVQRAL